MQMPDVEIPRRRAFQFLRVALALSRVKDVPLHFMDPVEEGVIGMPVGQGEGPPGEVTQGASEFQSERPASLMTHL